MGHNSQAIVGPGGTLPTSSLGRMPVLLPADDRQAVLHAMYAPAVEDGEGVESAVSARLGGFIGLYNDATRIYAFDQLLRTAATAPGAVSDDEHSPPALPLRFIFLIF